MSDPVPSAAVEAAHYDRRTIALHWITAALVVSLWALGQTIDWFAKGDPRVMARSVHITLGLVLAGVLGWRLAWRNGGGRQLPPVGPPWMRAAAAWTHRALYLLLAAAVLLGIANAFVRGDTVFKLFTLNPIDPGNKALRSTVGGLHELAANALLTVAGLHAGAGLLHGLAWKDGVLQRMLPRAARH